MLRFAGEHLRYLNREVRTRNHQASDEGFLDVRMPVAALESFELDPAAVSLQLLDTPGPNEFGEEALKHQVGSQLWYLSGGKFPTLVVFRRDTKACRYVSNLAPLRCAV